MIGQRWHRLSACAPRLVGATQIAISIAAILLFAASVPADAQAQQKSGAGSSKSGSSASLRKLGNAVSEAVLKKDIPSLLSYDRSDLRAADEVSLKNPKGDLYCYIFDSDCITWGSGNWLSVYEKLSQAHPLEIKVTLSHSPYDRQVYGSILFYDASSVSAKDLRSPEFLCKEGPAKVASWKFRLENGKWKAVTPLFDSETHGPCPSDQGDNE